VAGAPKCRRRRGGRGAAEWRAGGAFRATSAVLRKVEAAEARSKRPGNAARFSIPIFDSTIPTRQLRTKTPVSLALVQSHKGPFCRPRLSVTLSLVVWSALSSLSFSTMAGVRTYAEEAAFIERVNGHSYRHGGYRPAANKSGLDRLA